MLEEIQKMLIEGKFVVAVEDHLSEDSKSLIFTLKDVETGEEIFLTELVITC